MTKYYYQRVDSYIWYVFRKFEGVYGGFTEIVSAHSCVSDARAEARLLQSGETL